jgi:hypothetical protein
MLPLSQVFIFGAVQIASLHQLNQEQIHPQKVSSLTTEIEAEEVEHKFVVGIVDVATLLALQHTQFIRIQV